MSSDEKYYLAALEEVHAEGMREGLWAKALVEAEGDERRAEALYVKWRVGEMKRTGLMSGARRGVHIGLNFFTEMLFLALLMMGVGVAVTLIIAALSTEGDPGSRIVTVLAAILLGGGLAFASAMMLKRTESRKRSL